ncbi:hypothetical protein ACIBBB_31685 [Streptomyces sp. NPDC051217]|uniref:hypothetical protein n=1 Tax=Streptomyces sp. NPDC051217 TaxID=3365644 RepID=UPI0037BB94F5
MQVMADGRCPGVGALVVRTGEQIVHQFSAQPQLDLGDVPQVGQLQGQRAEELAPMPRQRDEPFAEPCGLGPLGCLAQE